MKLQLLSDIHLTWNTPVGRLDDFHTTQFNKLKFVLDYAEKNKTILLQAGDLFHRPRNFYVLSRFLSLFMNYDNNFYCVIGQHDRYLYNEDIQSTNMGVLSKIGLVNILDTNPVVKGNINIYGASYGQEVPEVKDKNVLNVLVIHESIYSDYVPFNVKKELKANVFLDNHPDYDLILCGDIHQSFVCKDKDRWLVNTGSLSRLEANDYNFTHKPHFLVYDTETKELVKVTIPHKPAEEVLSRTHIESKSKINDELEKFIQSIAESQAVDGVEFKDVLKKLIDKEVITKEVTDILGDIMQRQE